MSYNYSSSNKGHSSRSAKNQTYVSYSSKSKEYKLYEPKSLNNCIKDSGNESQPKAPLTNRDKFDAERPYHTREKRFEKNRGYKPQEHPNGWQNKNNRYHARIKDNVRIDYIPVLESRDAGTSKEADIHDTAEADRADRVEKRNSNQTFESDSNEAETLKSGYKTRIGLSTASSEEQSSGNESCRTSEFMQGQNCDIQSFWEKIKNTDFKEPGSTSGETPKEGKESSSKAENRNLTSDKSQTDLNMKSLTHVKAKFEKVLFIEDNENDQINVTNQRSSSNNGNVSEETEESDDEKYSDIDIMVEKKLLNNGECEPNHDDNVFDDFNEGTRKEDVEDLDTSERPVWENSDTTKLLEDSNKESYASIPDCLLNSQRPENVEAIGTNIHENIQKGGIENAIPPTFCNEKMLKSILNIDTESAKPSNVEKQVMVQDLACAFIPWNNTRMTFNDRPGNYSGPKNVRMRRDPPMFDKTYSNFPQLQTVNNNKEGRPYYNYYQTIQTPFYPINNSAWQTYGVNYGYNVIGAPLNDKNNPFFNTQILDDESFIIKNIENLLLDSPKLCPSPSLADLNVFLETIKKNNQSPTSSCEPKKAKQYLSLSLFGEVTWRTLIEEEEETNGNKDPQAASLCLLKW